jgi:glycosyltransferase involved in cell wall biosynthesis
MKILIVNSHPQDVVGGSEIQCDLLARHLTRLGNHVIYLAVDGKQAHYEAPYLVEPAMLQNGGLQRILRKYQPDVVYWRFNRRKFLPSVLICKRFHVKVVFAVSSGSDLLKWSHRVTFRQLSFSQKLTHLYPVLRHLLAMRLHYLGYHFVDGVIAQLDRQTGHLPVRCEVVIPNSVDATSTLFQWGKPFVVWVGSFKSVKNPDLYVELARHFQHTGVDFLMLGQPKAPYDKLLNQSPCPPNLHCLGLRPYPEVNGIIRQSLLLVQTSDIEGFPNVFIQAWMQAKPTIGLYYDPDGLVQKHGLGFISGNMEQMVQDTTTLIEDASLREQIGQRARQYAESRFKPEKNIPKVEAFLREICRESRS